jgi:F1F0 ATPase subunit 2
MDEAFNLIPSLAAGFVLGTLFFGGLWWTVRKGLTSNQPALWFFGSQLLRMSMTLAGFYLVGRDRWESLLACLVGFVIARLVIMRLLHAAEKPVDLTQEASHAP